MKNQIELTQRPIIKHDLIAVGASVSARIEQLNVENLVATHETIKSMKDLRATLNKEAKEFEAQRKAVKEAVNTPYSEFEEVYKVEVKEKYTDAVNVLKDKIGAFEIRIKEEKQANIERYFQELCQVEKIDFVKFSQVNLKIDLSTSEKKYKEFCNEYIVKVQDDIRLIESDPNQAEVMAEYKKTLNASKAITDVRARKEAEKQEKARILAKRTQDRENMLRKWNMNYHDMTRCFVLAIDDTITVKQSHVETYENKDGIDECAVLELRIKEAEAKFNNSQMKPEQEPNQFTRPEVKKPLEAPKEVKEEEVFNAVFEVEGSMAQLKALGAYMKEQGIKYKNI